MALTEKQLDAIIDALPVETTAPVLNPNGQTSVDVKPVGQPTTEPLQGPVGIAARLHLAQRGVIGLTKPQVHDARLRACFAAVSWCSHKEGVYYTEQWPERWPWRENTWPWKASGRPKSPNWPKSGDCSGSSSNWLFIGLEKYKVGDIVNGYGKREGYTGTQVQHGVPVSIESAPRGALLFYGGTAEVPAHVAMVVSPWNVKKLVVSMGMQGDPKLYPFDLYGALPLRFARNYIRF